MPPDGLIERFVASFEKLDEMAEFPEIYPLVRQLAVGSPDLYGRQRWKPMETRTDPSQLEPLLAKLPARFPPLFEQLVLSYRWAEVDLQLYRLLPNPPGPDLNGLLKETSKAPDLGRTSASPAIFSSEWAQTWTTTPCVLTLGHEQKARTVELSRSITKKFSATIV